MTGHEIHHRRTAHSDPPGQVFVGSCTNARIEELRTAAQFVASRRVAQSVYQALVVSGFGLIKAQPEAESLDRLFIGAGFEWREPGCSMCLRMNEDRLGPGERHASTSNRDFEGRQRSNVHTHLGSPAVAAAAAAAIAIGGHFANTHLTRPRPGCA